MAPTAKEIYDGRAGVLWNIICCPFVCTLGLFFRSIQIYCGPCLNVLFFRCAQRVHRYICCCCGWPYVDDSFIGAAALGDHSADDESKQTAEEMEKETEWVRAHELKVFKGKVPQLFEGDIEPSDLCQGAVGDCWLVAAFACASEHPDCIRSLFKTKEYNPRGKYEVRIYDPIKEKFVIVSVDDRIPCEKGSGGTPRFMQPNGSELWAIILEKAYAKFCGSYAKLNGGFVLWGWHAMTGDNVFQMSRNDDATWYREDMVPIKDAKDRRACGFRKTKETYTEENLWTLLKKYDKQKALLSASIGKTEYGKFSGPNGEEMLDKEGLVAGHAYSVLAAKEVVDSSKNAQAADKVLKGITAGTVGGGKPEFRLMQLRNPWGTFEWKGNWSDNSPLWKKYPHLKKELHVDADDGAFWMSFEDFKNVYTRVNVCDRTTTQDASLEVNEGDGCCGVIKGWFVGCTKFWICCHGVRNLYFGHESTDETLDAAEKGCCGC